MDVCEKHHETISVPFIFIYTYFILPILLLDSPILYGSQYHYSLAHYDPKQS